MKTGDLLIGYFDHAGTLHLGPTVCPKTELGMGAAVSVDQLERLSYTNEVIMLCRPCQEQAANGGSWTL